MGLMSCDWKVRLIRGWKLESDKLQLDADVIKQVIAATEQDNIDYNGTRLAVWHEQVKVLPTFRRGK